MKRTFTYILIFAISFFLIDQSVGRAVLYGINRFYGLAQYADVLIIGHSHIMLSIDKEELESETGMKVSKYTREGVNLFDRYVMVQHFLDSPYSDSLKYVMYGVDQYSFVKAGLSENSYKLFYPFMESSVMDEYIRQSAENARDYYTHKLFHLTRYSDALLNAAVRGCQNDYSNYKYGVIDIVSLKKNLEVGNQQFARSMSVDSELLDTFDKTVQLITERGLKLILINTPTLDLLKQQNPEAYQKVIAIFQSYADLNDNVEYWDFNPEYESDYSLFYDPIHLNPEGQKKITSELITKLIYK